MTYDTVVAPMLIGCCLWLRSDALAVWRRQACAMQRYVAGSPKQLAMAPGDVFDILDSAAPWWIVK